MTEVFVDSFFWLALLNERDTYHHQAVQMLRPARMVTTEAVRIEVLDAMSGLRLRPLAVRFWYDSNDDRYLIVLSLADPLLNQAVTLYANHQDKAWSLTDCISFVVMRERGIVEALTGDHHFEQAGFHCLLKTS